jgi:signal peptidase I
MAMDQTETTEVPTPKKKNRHSAFFDTLETIVISLAIFVFIYVFVAFPTEVDGHSMDHTLANGEHLIVERFSYRFGNPQRGDIIVFQYSPGYFLVKRVMGLPGDTVRLSGGNVYINGEKVVENAYLSTGEITYGIDFLQENQTVTVPANHYFVMGDNRVNSSDSRVWGYVARSSIEGKAWLVWYPFTNFHSLPTVTYKQVDNSLVAQQ